MAPTALVNEASSEPSLLSVKPTVYLLDNFHPAAVTHCQKLFHTILPGTPDHANWREKAQYLLVRSSYLTGDDISSCPNLHAIGKQGVGIDKINTSACAARGIKIFNTPGVNASAVAELVLALISTVARDVSGLSVRQNSGGIVHKEMCDGLILRHKTIGILGMGNIGKTVAKMFRGAYEGKIVAYDPFLPANAWSELEYKRAGSVHEVLREADVVSIHVPLSAETRGLISYPQLQMMKREAILINAARGGIVNEDDLERGLREGLIWGAGLDCHEHEPPTKQRYERLWAQRVVSTPHIGAATSQTQIETAMAAIDRLYDYAKSQNVK